MRNKTTTKPTVTETNDALDAHFAETRTLEDLCEALAEGEHNFSRELTRAAYAVIQWPGNDYGARS